MLIWVWEPHVLNTTGVYGVEILTDVKDIIIIAENNFEV